MLDFERLDGFIIDLSTKEKTLEQLQYVLHDNEDRKYITEKYDLDGIRSFILEYYINTYSDAYIFVKNVNVYQVCESELREVR